jgi:hypothetical protein
VDRVGGLVGVRGGDEEDEDVEDGGEGKQGGRYMFGRGRFG